MVELEIVDGIGKVKLSDEERNFVFLGVEELKDKMIMAGKVQVSLHALHMDDPFAIENTGIIIDIYPATILRLKILKMIIETGKRLSSSKKKSWVRKYNINLLEVLGGKANDK
ncbi:MAG: hypothetical protein QXL94_01540 [Candidatus Parvarchaeum sp.]